MSPQEYLELIVEPTVAEFEQDQASVRRVFLASVAVFHTIDYIRPKRTQNLRKLFRDECPAFAKIDRVAHAFKHVESDGKVPLKASAVYGRPPALAGAAMAGRSLAGDPTGAVLIDGESGNSLIVALRESLDFLRKKL
jgi:hypothetical protein